MTKTFLFGVGAQKAGTSWLYQYLVDHPECEMGVLKEHGVWVSLLGARKPSVQFANKATYLTKTLERMRALQAQGEPIPDRMRNRMLGLADNLNAEFDVSYYMNYYERLGRISPNARLFADITPEYSTLTADQMTTVRETMEGAGFDVKVIYLMRDPVERAYSAMRMRDRDAALAGKEVQKTARQRFMTALKSPYITSRTSYNETLETLDQVFAPENIFHGFYETLFTTDTVQQVCDFLGLTYQDPDFDLRINESPRNEDLWPKQIAAARQHFDTTYSYCAERFGEDMIADIWPHYRVAEAD